MSFGSWPNDPGLSAAPSGAAGGDLSGNYPNPTVSKSTNITPFTSTNGVDTPGFVRSSSNVGIPAAGSGAEMVLAAGTAFFQGFDRGGAAYIPVRLDGSTISVGSAGHSVGFYGVAPVARPAAYTLTYPTNNRTLAADAVVDPAATAATNVTPFGYTTAAQADAIRASVIELHAELNNVRQVLRQMTVDMQANGLLQ